MFLLVQNPSTGLYLKERGEWVPDESEAKTFSNALTLYNFCEENGLQDVHIIIKDGLKPRKPALGTLPFQNISW